MDPLRNIEIGGYREQDYKKYLPAKTATGQEGRWERLKTWFARRWHNLFGSNEVHKSSLKSAFMDGLKNLDIKDKDSLLRINSIFLTRINDSTTPKLAETFNAWLHKQEVNQEIVSLFETELPSEAAEHFESRPTLDDEARKEKAAKAKQTKQTQERKKEVKRGYEAATAAYEKASKPEKLRRHSIMLIKADLEEAHEKTKEKKQLRAQLKNAYFSNNAFISSVPALVHFQRLEEKVQLKKRAQIEEHAQQQWAIHVKTIKGFSDDWNKPVTEEELHKGGVLPAVKEEQSLLKKIEQEGLKNIFRQEMSHLM